MHTAVLLGARRGHDLHTIANGILNPHSVSLLRHRSSTPTSSAASAPWKLPNRAARAWRGVARQAADGPLIAGAGASTADPASSQGAEQGVRGAVCKLPCGPGDGPARPHPGARMGVGALTHTRDGRRVEIYSIDVL